MPSPFTHQVRSVEPPKIFNLWVVLATLVAGINLFNLASDIISYGGWWVIRSVVETLQKLSLLVFQRLPSLFGLDISEKTAEGWAFSFLLGGCIARAVVMLMAPKEAQKRKIFIRWAVILTIITSLTMITGVVAAFSSLVIIHPRYRQEAIQLIFGRFERGSQSSELIFTLSVLYWWTSILVMLAFFALSGVGSALS